MVLYFLFHTHVSQFNIARYELCDPASLNYLLFSKCDGISLIGGHLQTLWRH